MAQISLEDLDFLRSLSQENSQSIIKNGTVFCNDYFKNNKYDKNLKYENFFMCKFSKKRNRFYIYMLAVEKDQNKSLSDFCIDIIRKKPEVSDHLDKKLSFQKKLYLDGFYVDNFYYDSILSFSNDESQNKITINNQINKFIQNNRFSFTIDNVSNNKKVSKEIEKISKIYRKIISQDDSSLDKVIKNQLDKIVRYKIFINDTSKFISYSCNWIPGKGIKPYVKREKFNEFENI
tara:strand:+ start:52 stop:753 length:702 start_codon:yes stop_codon:yes gene_type:complete